MKVRNNYLLTLNAFYYLQHTDVTIFIKMVPMLMSSSIDNQINVLFCVRGAKYLYENAF